MATRRGWIGTAVGLVAPATLTAWLTACGWGELTALPADGAPRGGTPPAGTATSPATPPVMPGGLEEARVERVVDGDTLDVSPGGRLRLIGIDTPETVDPRRPVECFGREASASIAALVQGQTVLLEVDESQPNKDVFNRLLRFVWLSDGRQVNFEQVAQGYAHELTVGSSHKYRELFRQAQRSARDRGIGLWSPATCHGHTAREAPTAGPSPAARQR